MAGGCCASAWRLWGSCGQPVCARSCFPPPRPRCAVAEMPKCGMLKDCAPLQIGKMACRRCSPPVGNRCVRSAVSTLSGVPHTVDKAPLLSCPGHGSVRVRASGKDRVDGDAAGRHLLIVRYRSGVDSAAFPLLPCPCLHPAWSAHVMCMPLGVSRRLLSSRTTIWKHHASLCDCCGRDALLCNRWQVKNLERKGAEEESVPYADVARYLQVRC